MRRCDGVKIAGEMQVDIFHRHNLRIAAARSAALHAKAWAERRLTQSHNRLFANFVQAIAQANRGCGFAFARRGWVNCCDQNQLAVLTVFQCVDVRKRHFGLGVAIGNEVSLRNS